MEIALYLFAGMILFLLGWIAKGEGLFESNSERIYWGAEIRENLLLILKNQKHMSAELDAIKADLVAAQELQVKIAADVQRLHDQITALGDAPTPEQLAEVKALSSALVSSLQATDAVTPE
jgi:hypothetical protein